MASRSGVLHFISSFIHLASISTLIASCTQLHDPHYQTLTLSPTLTCFSHLFSGNTPIFWLLHCRYYCSILTTLPLGGIFCLHVSSFLWTPKAYGHIHLLCAYYSLTYLPICICLHVSTFLHPVTWGPWQTFTNSLTVCVKLYVMCICAFFREQACDFHYCLTGAFDSKVVKNYSIKAIPEK